MSEKLRVGFVNSGILGHRSVARLVHEAVAGDPTLETVDIDVDGSLTIGERIARRIICFDSVRESHGALDAFLFTRWRHEFRAGLVAANRLAAQEKLGGPFGALHFHTQATAMASIKRMHHTPSVVSIDITQHLASLESSSFLGPLAYRPSALHDRAIFRAAAAIVSPSRWAARDLARQHPECADKVYTLPYPVRLELFSPDWVAERRARSEARDAAVRVLFIGGDFPRKGGFDLLRIWRNADFGSRAELRIVTDWPLDAAELPRGVTQTRSVRAFSDDWVAVWRNADVFVMPTRAEAVGMVFQEAAAAGVPAIGTRINAIPEIVVDGRTGLLVTPADGIELVGALESLIRSRDRRHAMAVASRQRAESAISVAAYGERLSTLLHAAAQLAA